VSTSIPKLLRAVVVGYSGPSYAVELSDGELHYVAWNDSDTIAAEETITPTADQWQEFRTALDSIGIWQWQDDYPSELSICDGTQWSLDIAYEDAALRSGGDNAYPKDEDDDGTIPSGPLRHISSAS
jgi:hypothetical protein